MQTIGRYAPVKPLEIKLLLAQGCTVLEVAAMLNCSAYLTKQAMRLFGWQEQPRGKAIEGVSKAAGSGG